MALVKPYGTILEHREALVDANRTTNDSVMDKCNVSSTSRLPKALLRHRLGSIHPRRLVFWFWDEIRR